MTPRIRRILAVPGGHAPRADFVEALGCDPRRILRRQRTFSVCLSPALPIPLESFRLESFRLESFPLESFPLESFPLESFALESF